MLVARFFTAPSGITSGCSKTALVSLKVYKERVRSDRFKFLNGIVQTSFPRKELTQVIDLL
jgi:hypothetical protein